MGQLVWLVTGCSSGLGVHLVREVLARGDKVIATARRLEAIETLKSAGATILQLDVTEDQRVIDGVLQQAIEIYGAIDVVVNNAAYIAVGIIEDLQYEDFRAQFETNVFGPIKITRAILPHFRQRRSGCAVFIGSLSGWIGHPGCSAYAGSKFALEGIVEAFAAETKDLGIKTLLIEPGRFRTNLLSSDKRKSVASRIPEYRQFSDSFLAGLGAEDQQQPGDPQKLVRIVADLVREEGVAKDKLLPLRLPLGNDVLTDIKAKCENTLQLLREWESVIQSTDY